MIAAIASADNAAANEIFFKTVPPDGLSLGAFRGHNSNRCLSKDAGLRDEFESVRLSRNAV
jgi:hypothetical protein